MATLILAMAAHWHVHLGYLRRINFAEPPPAPRETGRPPPRSPPAARRVLVLLLDGLGFDAALTLPPFRAVAAQGVARPLMAEFPSFTFASMTALATGRPPLWSGVRVNGPRPARAWDSVSREAAAAGKGVVLADSGFGALASLLALPPEARRVGIGEAFHGHADLAWVYFGEVDSASHRRGTRSAEWGEAAAQAGALVSAARAALDPERDTLFVLSDHGHLPRGGHGGVEPEALRATFLALGPGILRGAALPPLAMRDVAPTLAAALSLPPPRDSLGRAALDLWGLEGPRDDSEARADAEEARLAFRQEAFPRLVGAAVLLLLAVGALFLWKALPGIRDFLPAAAFTALFALGYLAAGYRVSWSIGRSQPVFELETAILACAALTLAGLLSRRERRTEEAVATALSTGGASLLFAAWLGWSLSRLASSAASFAFLLAVTLFFYGGYAWGFSLLNDQRALGRPAWLLLLAGSLLLFAAPLALRYWLPAW